MKTTIQFRILSLFPVFNLETKIKKYVIFPPVFHGDVRMFENRLLRRIFGPKSHEVSGGWKELHNEEFLNLYSSLHMIRAIKSKKVGGHVARMEETRIAYKILIGKPEA
jgi:hypothetical protein